MHSQSMWQGTFTKPEYKQVKENRQQPHNLHGCYSCMEKTEESNKSSELWRGKSQSSQWASLESRELQCEEAVKTGMASAHCGG